MKDAKPNAQLHYVNAGQSLLYAADGNITLWATDWATDKAEPRATFKGHLVGVASTGASFITLDEQNTFRAWDAATGTERPLATLSKTEYPFHQRAHLANRRDLGKASLEVRDPLGEYPPQVLDIHAKVGGFLEAWLPLPERRVAVVLWGAGGRDDTRGEIFDLETGNRFLGFWAEWYDPTLRLTADSKHLVSSGTLGAWWLRLPPPLLERMPSQMSLKVDEGNCAQLALHPQHPLRFAVAIWRLGQPDEVCIMEPEPGKGTTTVVQKWVAPGRVLALAFDAPGARLAGRLENGAVVQWDCATGQVVGALGELPTAAAEGAALVLKRWQLERHRPWLRFDPTGTLLVHEAKNTLRFWDWRTAQLQHSGPGNFIGWARDGKTFLTRREGEHCTAYTTATWAEMPLADIQAASYPLAHRLVVTGRQHPPAVYVWDALGELPGELIYAANRDSQLENWSLTPSGEAVVLLPIEAEEMAHVAVHARVGGAQKFSAPRIAYSEQAPTGPNGWLALCMREWRVYCLPNKEILGTTAHKGDALAFHPACTPTAAWGAVTQNAHDHAEVRFFAINTLLPRSLFCPNLRLPRPVTYLTFHPTGRYLACLLNDGTVEVWDVAWGKQVVVLAAS